MPIGLPGNNRATRRHAPKRDSGSPLIPLGFAGGEVKAEKAAAQRQNCAAALAQHERTDRLRQRPSLLGPVRLYAVDELAQLQRQCALLSRAANDENVRDYLRANRAFHFIIYNAARSPTLVAMIETLWLQIGPYLNLLRGSGNYVASNATHRAIVDALADHDGKAAAKALRADINDAYAILSKMLR
jgi:FCD domain